jgi:hypothetical protein
MYVNENCAFLGYYAASSGNFLLTFWDNLSVHLQGSRIKELFFSIPYDGTGGLSRNIDKKLPLLVAQ